MWFRLWKTQKIRHEFLMDQRGREDFVFNPCGSVKIRGGFFAFKPKLDQAEKNAVWLEFL